MGKCGWFRVSFWIQNDIWQCSACKEFFERMVKGKGREEGKR